MKSSLLLAVALIFGSLAVFSGKDKAKIDLRPPREVLPGHWKSVDGRVDYYFAQEHLVMVDNGKVVGDFKLETVEENVPELWIKIKLDADQANLRTLRVDFNRKGFMETFAYQGVTINNIMLYAGAKQKP